MSCDPEWLLFRIPPARLDELAARFTRAAERSRPGKETLALLERWRRDPEGPVADGTLRVFEPFISKGFQRLACELFAEFTDRSDEDPFEALLLGRAVLNRIPPTLPLWIGLGPARADRLPGHFGNLLVAPAEIPAALEAVRAALDLPRDEYFARALPALEWGNNGRALADAEELRVALPAALERALAEGCGLLGLCAAELVPPWWKREHPPLLSEQIPRRTRPAPPAEAAQLREDLASGRLPQACVEVAALLGYPAALAALDRAMTTRGDLGRRVYQLSDRGNEPYFRALLGIAQGLVAAHTGPLALDPETEEYLHLVGRFGREEPVPERPFDLGVALRAAIDAVRRPGDDAREAAREAMRPARGLDRLLATLTPGSPGAAMVVVAMVARAACWYEPGEERMWGSHDEIVRHAASSLGEDGTWRAITDAVVPWALGYEDPLAPGTPRLTRTRSAKPSAATRSKGAKPKAAKPSAATRSRGTKPKAKATKSTKTGAKPKAAAKSKARGPQAKPRGRTR